jgi:glycosyltransferase involved in cell wall biosynthesis
MLALVSVVLLIFKFKNMKKVSVIIPCFNHAPFLENSVKSALDQNYQNIEVIIANDGSTDNSLEVANKLASLDKRVRVLTRENRGVVATRNEAIAMSTGDYILPLDADDYLASNDVIEAMAEALDNDPEIVLVFGNYQSFGAISSFVRSQLGDISKLLIKDFIPATSMFTREVFDKVGGYSDRMIGGYEYWEFVIRVTNSGKIHKIEKTIYFYRTQPISRNTEADKIKETLFENIINNNNAIYSMNVADVILNMQKEINFYRKSLKSQRKIKKIMAFGLLFQLIINGVLIFSLIN